MYDPANFAYSDTLISLSGEQNDPPLNKRKCLHQGSPRTKNNEMWNSQKGENNLINVHAVR